jgi:HAMP domain-containing protein
MSARDLPIYVTQSAPPPTAQWLRQVLAPVVEACRFQLPPPLQVRPVGAWAGICESRTLAPDLRVCASSKIVFWTAENIASVYLHECCHRLLESQVGMQHGPEFFCLNALLLLRSAAAFKSDPIFQLDLYDMQDCSPELLNEPNWRGIVLGWALHTATELADTDASAEALAQKVCQRWLAFNQEREQSRIVEAQQAFAARKNAAAQVQRIENLQSSLFVARTFLVASFISLFSVVYFVFR